MRVRSLDFLDTFVSEGRRKRQKTRAKTRTKKTIMVVMVVVIVVTVVMALATSRPNFLQRKSAGCFSASRELRKNRPSLSVRKGVSLCIFQILLQLTQF